MSGPIRVSDTAQRVTRITAADRVLLLAPHPDDESIAAGGLLQVAIVAGASVRVMYVTDGDRNPWAQLVAERRWPAGESARARWGALRREEGRRSLALLGVTEEHTTWLGLPDQRLTDLLHDGDRRLLRALVAEIRDRRPTLIVAPVLYDRHPDHSAAAVTLAFALARCAAEASEVRTLGYRVHAGRHDPAPAMGLPLDPATRQRKRAAILCHETQLRWHRETLPACATVHEGYESTTAPPESWEPHLVHEAAVEQETLRITFARGRRIGLGPRLMRIALADHLGRVTCMAARLPDRAGELRLERRTAEDAAPARAASATLERAGGDWRLSLPLGRPPRACFVKIERPRERALGFFDEAGWWPAALAAGARTPRDAGSAALAGSAEEPEPSRAD